MTQVSSNDKGYAASDHNKEDTTHKESRTTDIQRTLHWLTGRWATLTISTVLFSAALFLNLRHLATPSIWFDEAFSVELARQPLPLLWHIIFGPEPNMELYYLFLHFWLGLTQSLGWLPTEFVVRFPSTIFAALSTVVVFWLGKRSMGLFAGIVAAILYMLNYLQLVYAQQTRSYSLQLLLICLAWYALFNALRAPTTAVGAGVDDVAGRAPAVPRWTKRTQRESISPTMADPEGPLPASTPPSPLRKYGAHFIAPTIYRYMWWLTYVFAMALAVYAHLFSLLVLLSQIVAIALLLLIPNAWRAEMRAQFRSFIGSLLSLGILILPMLIESRQGAKTSWLPVPHKNDIIYLTQMMSGFSRAYLLVIALFCAVGVLLVTMAYILGHTKGEQKDGQGQILALHSPNNEIPTGVQLFPVVLSMLCWLLLPPIISYFISQGSLRLFSSRYLVVIVPPLCLLMALGVSTLRWSAIVTNKQIARFTAIATQGIFAFLLLLLALPAVPQYYKSAQVEDWNTVSHWITQHYQQNDGLVCYDNDVQQGCQISIEYYLHAYPSAAHFDSDTPGAFSWTQFTSHNPDAAVDPNTLAAYGVKHPRIFFIVGRLPDDRAAAKVKVAQQWLDNHFHLVGTFEKRTVIVRLYETYSA